MCHLDKELQSARVNCACEQHMTALRASALLDTGYHGINGTMRAQDNGQSEDADRSCRALARHHQRNATFPNTVTVRPQR